MTRTGADAVHYARGRVGPDAMPASGYCLQFVRECFAVGAYYGSAIDAWNGAQHKHPGDRHPPMAVPLYFSSPSVYDHVVFGGDPGGQEIMTTFNDDVRRYTGPDAIDQICRDFDAQYLGWAEDVNGVTIYTPTTPPTPTPTPTWPEDDTMEIIRIVDDGRIMVVGTYQFAQVPDMATYGALENIWGPYTDVNIQDAQRMNDQVNRNIVDLGTSMKGQGLGGVPTGTRGAGSLRILAALLAVALLTVGVLTAWVALHHSPTDDGLALVGIVAAVVGVVALASTVRLTRAQP